MNVREIQARTLLSAARDADPWFGIKYTMNLYRGCQHHCIYCDSRSACYGIADFDGEVLVKGNALELLRAELGRRARPRRGQAAKGYVGTGSMNDPYMPLERQMRLTQGALQIIAEFAFPVHVLTKSDLVLRDADLLREIERGAGVPGGSPGAVISFTITTADDDLSRVLEPGAPPSSARFRAMGQLSKMGLRTGVMLMPVLPFIGDSVAGVTEVIIRAAACGAGHVVPAWGTTMRTGSREYFYEQLDRHFPGMRPRYERAFAYRYEAGSPNARSLEAAFAELSERYRLARVVAPYRAPEPDPEQLPLL
jgi:DNA repair photolyase